MNLHLSMKLISDTCPGSGENSAGVIDTEIAADSYGIPMIQGRRVKGLFHEAAKELLEFGLTDTETVEETFGKQGKTRENAVFQTLYPTEAEELKKFIRTARKDSRWKEYVRKDRVTGFYTSVRSQTAMENGVAKNNSLRTIRVVNKGNVFEGEIVLYGEDVQKQAELLKNCAKMIRHIGINRTKGMGNVECTLEEMEALDERKFEKLSKLWAAFSEGKENISYEEGVLPVHIYLEQPCAVEKDYIAGGMVKGIFASEYARWSKSEGRNTELLHEDPLFYSLFLGSDVKYGYCWPCEKNACYCPVPYSFVKEKKSQGNEWYDLAALEPEELEDALKDKESYGEKFITLKTDFHDDLVAYGMNPERIELYHHRRPQDRSIGHAQKASGTAAGASDGQLYSREALAGEQEFYGEIRGKKELLEVLKELLPEKNTCYVGASRTAQYGKAVISYQNPIAAPESEELENTVITLLSPMAVTDDFGNPSTKVQDVVRTIFEGMEEISQDKYTISGYCREEIIEGFNSRRNMPIPQRNVLKPGSVIVVYGMELDEDQIDKLNQYSYGLYQDEGYGRIRVNWHGEMPEGRYQDADTEDTESVPGYEKCFPKTFVDDCLKQRLESFYKKKEGCIDALGNLIAKVPNSHVLSGMTQICKTSGSFEALQEQLNKAAERATEKNSAWYKHISLALCGDREKISNKENAFYDQGVRGIRSCGLYSDWKEQLTRLLDENDYEIFKKFFMQMMYEEHLKEREGGAGNE